MDPLGSIDVAADTTFVLMPRRCGAGHRVLYVDPADLAVADGRPIARARPADGDAPGARATPRSSARRQIWSLDERSGRRPPAQGSAGGRRVRHHDPDPRPLPPGAGAEPPGGDPRGEREALRLRLSGADGRDARQPPISRSSIDFMAKLGGEMIVKPLDGKGGEGIFHLRHDDRNLFSILEQSTAFETRRVMAQRYLPEVRQGDKRILLLDGEPIGAVLRVPRGAGNALESPRRGSPASAPASTRTIVGSSSPGPLAAPGRPLLRRDRRHRGAADRGERHVADGGAGDQCVSRGARLEARILDGVERLLDEKRIASRNFPSLNTSKNH